MDFLFILICYLRFIYNINKVFFFAQKKQLNVEKKYIFSTLILTLSLKRPVLRGGSFKAYQ